MKPLSTPTKRISLLSALAIAAALTACSKQEDDMTAGQRLDGAVADAKRAADETRQEAKQAVAGAEATAARAAEQAAQATTDMGITAKVNAALVADDKLKATKINVDTREGMVTLTGKAPDSQSRERATTLASAVNGVKHVNNQLVVSTS
jgi:hyperosmotically inducible protein